MYDEKELIEWTALGYHWGRMDEGKWHFEFSNKWLKFVRAQEYKRLSEFARDMKRAYDEFRRDEMQRARDRTHDSE